MSNERSLEVPDLLARGIDPTSGEGFPPDSPYQNADVVRALHDGITALQHAGKAPARKKHAPEKAGRSWTKNEDKTLLQKYSSGMQVNDLAKRHGRSDRAIISRLARLGWIQGSFDYRPAEVTAYRAVNLSL
jgi:hypothetical protein